MTMQIAIIIAVIWLMPSAALISKYVSGHGLYLSIVVAISMTLYLTKGI